MLCIHGEVVDPEVDFFEREQVFIADKLEPMLAQVPNLKVVIEHATTKEAVAFVEASQRPAGIGKDFRRFSQKIVQKIVHRGSAAPQNQGATMTDNG